MCPGTQRNLGNVLIGDRAEGASRGVSMWEHELKVLVKGWRCRDWEKMSRVWIGCEA